MRWPLEVVLFVAPAFGYLHLPLHRRLADIGRDSDVEFAHVAQKRLVLPESDANERFVPKDDPLSDDDATGIRIQAVDERACQSGSRQLTGHVNVTSHKSLFWWFHASRRDPKNDPLIIWLNGGPGSSSFIGAFTELGPCLVNKDGMNTTNNPHSWTNFANVIFVDQPAGVGFSTVSNNSYLVYTADAAAADFSTFMRRLFKHALPEYASHKIHLIGESFAGIYNPSILTKILDQQRGLAEIGLPDPFPKIESVVLADALVDWQSTGLGIYKTVCVSRPDETGVKEDIYTEIQCRNISSMASDCERIGSECRLSYDRLTCTGAMDACSMMQDPFFELMAKGERSPYDMRLGCPDRQSCTEAATEPMNKYLNDPNTLSLLGLPPTTKYKDTNLEMNDRWSQWGFDVAIPTVGKIGRLLEETDIRLLAFNGNSDFLVPSEGTVEWMKLVPWAGNGEFRARDLEPWYYVGDDKKKAKGGLRKATKDGRFVFAGIDLAGHMAPGDQPAAVEQLVKAWVEGTVLSL
ncbi:hypothetical protein TWF696_008603 [Orbilia brochopaga]|uniref:carboxypeptidase C n=1 Tax=Orbilia brochopaga TaxID=3140254 RepID=A0AAV9UKA6_9PEZI